MFLLTAGKYLFLTFEMAKAGILSAMEYRVSFMIKIVGMTINDFALIFMWYIYFQKFPVVNGWTFEDTALLHAISMVNISLIYIFAAGVSKLSEKITNGELDYYLTYPKNMLWHIAVSRTDIAAIGDLLAGVIIFFVAVSYTPQTVFLFGVLSILTALITFNFMVIMHSITFYVGNFEDAAEELVDALFGFTDYPQTIFSGALKFIMIFILPAFFIATVPVQLMRQFDWSWFTILIGVWLISLGLAQIIFTNGLKRYESGNLINVNA